MKRVKEGASAVKECGAAIKEWLMVGLVGISLFVAYQKLKE